MTIIPNRQHQIFKFGFAIAIAVVFAISDCGIYAHTQNENEKSLSVDYSKFNTEAIKNSADKFFQDALNSTDEKEKAGNLKNAAAQYYILSNADKSDSYPCIRLARIYDLQKNDAYAKAYFYRVLGLNYKDSDANFYFAEFYFTREQYEKALEYYQKALTYGRPEDPETLKKIGQIYERFGDIPRASHYYKKSLDLNPNDTELSGKINENAAKEYENSGYYKRRLRN